MVFRDDSVIMAIREKNIKTLVDIFINRSELVMNSGFKTETELWDYKRQIPKLSGEEIEWAEVAKDVLGFYNCRGGLMFFGVDDTTFSIVGIDPLHKMDNKLFNDKIRKYTGDKIWVEYQIEYIGNNKAVIGIAIIPPRSNIIEKFKKNSPEKKGRCIFLESGSALRKNDST